MTTVRIPPTLRTETDGVREVAARGATLRQVLDDVATRFPALGTRILADGELAPFVNVYVEGEDVRTLSGLETPVREGSTVILLPAMAGGLLTTLAACRSRPAKPASAAG
jgi:molybdopterin converting factor small subunit